MYSRIMLTVISSHCRMSFNGNGCVSTLININWIKWMYFCVNEFQSGVNDSISSGNEPRKV